MKKLERRDIADLTEYEKRRKDFRAAIIALKKLRRVELGESLTLVFENRETVLFQVQEMVRVERLVEDAQIQAELDAFNPLIPDAGELSATLLVDITDPSRIRETLDGLIGLHRMLFLEVGGESIPARFDPAQFSDDRISAVQYLRFSFTPTQRAAFADPAIPARIRITHPNLQHETAIPAAVRASLIQDLA